MFGKNILTGIKAEYKKAQVVGSAVSFNIKVKEMLEQGYSVEQLTEVARQQKKVIDQEKVLANLNTPQEQVSAK